MEELALCCDRVGDAVDFIAVHGAHANRAGPLHIVAYVGGSLGGGRWRAERILLERGAGESVALVTEMGDWDAGSTVLR